MAKSWTGFKVNPAFHRHPQHARIIGRMLAAFGELEIQFCLLANYAAQLPGFKTLKALYRIGTTNTRLAAADALMRDIFATEFEPEYAELIGAIRHCQSIRNTYAHCNWADHQPKPRTGIFFIDLQEAAKPAHPLEFDFGWRHISLQTLKDQEAYFVYAQDWLFFLEHELRRSRGEKAPSFPKPSVRPQPIPHSPPGKHLPPWLSLERKVRFVEYLQAIEESARPREQKQQARPRKPSAKQRRQAALKKRGGA